MLKLSLYFFLLFGCSLLEHTVSTFTTRVFSKSSPCCVEFPEVFVTVGNGYKIISGGAYIKWRFTTGSLGVLLVSSYPSDDLKSWHATAKDHNYLQQAYIIAYAVAIYDPNNDFDVALYKSGWSDKVQHPTTIVSVPEDHALTGGGARIDYGNGQGNLLYASYPSSNTTWTASGKDHFSLSLATIMAFAIGIKPNTNSTYRFVTYLNSSTSPAGGYNSFSIYHDWALLNNYLPTGGGSIVNYTGPGALFTASYPLSQDVVNVTLRGWGVESKDHQVVDIHTSIVYAICVTTRTV